MRVEEKSPSLPEMNAGRSVRTFVSFGHQVAYRRLSHSEGGESYDVFINADFTRLLYLSRRNL